jgi:hypothetical protein
MTIIAIVLPNPQKNRILMTMVLVADMVTTVWTKVASVGQPATDTLLVGRPADNGAGWTKKAANSGL